MVYKLHLGSGGQKRVGYLNTDVVDGPNIDQVLDAASDKYPFEDNSLFEVYSSHVIEHIDVPKVLPMMKEWFRILKPWGKAIVEFPDFDAALLLYGNGDLDKCLQCIFGEVDYSRDPVPQYHKWAYNAMQITKLFQEAGFKVVEKVDSRDYHLMQFGLPTTRIEATKIIEEEKK